MTHRFFFTFCFISLFIAFSPLYAFLPPDENGFSFSVGGGAYYAPVYEGSDEYKATPVPLADIRYTRDNLQVFVSIMDGAGVLYTSTKTGIETTVSIKQGSPRSADDQDHLKGSPDIENPFYGSLDLGWWFSSYFGLSATAEYYPLSVDYSDMSDKKLNGLLVSPSIRCSYPLLSRLMLGGALGLSFINDGYARAYFGNTDKTERMDSYTAKGGLHDISASFSLFYLINAHITPVLFFEGTYLLGDARNSPLTQAKASGKVALMCMYKF